MVVNIIMVGAALDLAILLRDREEQRPRVQVAGSGLLGEQMGATREGIMGYDNNVGRAVRNLIESCGDLVVSAPDPQ